ncbi:MULTISPECIES: ABC transporter substrate-binding protein [Streptomyces]|uniref:ABC transporter substrate-binding protein n=1 Tax=Streptomyces TaxID=1883 RepID=UPI000691A333|nr:MULTISPECIES: ABC transporter substrate-binding protein [Streptomyces]
MFEAEIRLYNYDQAPAAPLFPGDPGEHCGARIVQLLGEGLVGYDPQSGAPHLEAAESVTTADSRSFTVTLKPGRTFHDGTPVLARHYVDAWNHTAYGPNGLPGAVWFEKVLGYPEVHPAQGRPSAERLAGLRILDELRFEVELAEPFATFPLALGLVAYFPLPDAYFADPEGFRRQPVGNGPYRFAGAESGTDYRLTAWPEHRGTHPPRIRGLRLTAYPTREQAYQALLNGELDYLDALPHALLADGRCERELAGRLVGRDGLMLQSLAFPGHLPGYGHPDLRRAVSLAIDRPRVIGAALAGRQRPADGWAVPQVSGYLPDQAGGWCTFDPERARTHLARSGFTGPLEIHSPVSARDWLRELADCVTEVLGIECTLRLYDRTGDYYDAVGGRTVTGAFRADWGADYPALENFLRPQFHSTGAFNDTGYARPEFDALLDAADTAPSQAEAATLYQRAERLLAEDLPHVPLWQEWACAGYSARLTDVRMTTHGYLDLTSVGVLG